MFWLCELEAVKYVGQFKVCLKFVEVSILILGMVIALLVGKYPCYLWIQMTVIKHIGPSL